MQTTRGAGESGHSLESRPRATDVGAVRRRAIATYVALVIDHADGGCNQLTKWAKRVGEVRPSATFVELLATSCAFSLGPQATALAWHPARPAIAIAAEADGSVEKFP